MSTLEPEALWETALEGPDPDSLAREIVALARSWAGDDPERLREAERILAKSRYLEGQEVSHDEPAA